MVTVIAFTTISITIQLQRNYITTNPIKPENFWHYFSLNHSTTYGGLALLTASYRITIYSRVNFLYPTFLSLILSISRQYNLSSVYTQSPISVICCLAQCRTWPRGINVVRYFRQHEIIYTDDITLMGSPYSINSNTNFGHCTIMIHGRLRTWRK